MQLFAKKNKMARERTRWIMGNEIMIEKDSAVYHDINCYIEQGLSSKVGVNYQ